MVARAASIGCSGVPAKESLNVEAVWDDVLALLERPYPSLTVAERFALRSQINDSSDCRRYYPQLFSGRWIPLQDE